MSFLNPVSEPVLRFKSTDTGAPQINYNVRTAGDVKAVLKACLVTGYGATASAGWTAANEVGNVVEFVSPSAAMSDYRLGIDDSTTANTTWYYQYQDARTNPVSNAPTKSFSYVNLSHASNGWQLLVSERGIIFIEILHNTAVSNLSSRITYLGQIKSALTSTVGSNILFFNVGQNAAISNPANIYSANTTVHINLGTHSKTYIHAANSAALEGLLYTMDTSAVDLISPMYLSNADKNLLLGELPPILSKIVNKSSDIYGVSETTVGSRNALSVCAGYAVSNANTARGFSRTFLVPLDYWEY